MEGDEKVLSLKVVVAEAVPRSWEKYVIGPEESVQRISLCFIEDVP